ncbi:MAG: putative peptidase [Firmicutes bacterium]|nr:putative peptidase [Bacillota bacterium]
MSLALQTALQCVANRAADLLAESVRIAEIPAPPFAEAERSAYIARRFREIGLQEVTVDDLGNVTGRRPGPEGSPRVLVASHMDTVFPAGTDVKVRVEGDIAYGPGIRDNSSAVANLINLVPVLDEADLALPCDLIVASCVGEEGLGDLRGIRRLMETWKGRVDAVIAYDGEFGGVVYGGVGSRRLRITYSAPGGHSFGDFGAASAVHGLALACSRFAQIAVPTEPKTTLNVGTFHGGSSVNAIAEEASAVIDMRSVGQDALTDLYSKAVAIFEQTAVETGCRLQVAEVGNRPGGLIPQDHPLARLAAGVVREMGAQPRFSVSSTDANIPLSQGVPAICIGAGNGGGVHTLREYLNIPSLVPGLQMLVRVLAGLDWSAVRA